MISVMFEPQVSEIKVRRGKIYGSTLDFLLSSISSSGMKVLAVQFKELQRQLSRKNAKINKGKYFES